MKKNITKLFLSISLLISFNSFASNPWQQVDPGQAPEKFQVMHPSHFLVYTMDEATLKLQLWNTASNPDEGVVISLPLPDGTFRDFIVWQSSMMPAELASRYPDIKTFTAEAVDDHRVTAKLDFTIYGFHAMIYSGMTTSFIDPYDLYHNGFYIVHYKVDETRPLSARMKCLVKGNDDNGPAGESMDIDQMQLPKLERFSRPAQRTTNGYQLRRYRLALCADDYYCQAATGSSSPTITASLSAMTTSMNRINGVYEREFSVTMVFVTHEDTLIWPTHTGSVNGTDPFYPIDAAAGSCLGENQTQCDTRIGSANYDIGHVFTTGGGGLSLQGVICSDGNKAQSVTGSPTPVGDGFDIDYVAHEMGHEHGASHPFNNNMDGSCAGNAVFQEAYEPGSGSTIMAYAGICDPDDLQPHSDAYFHAASLTEIINYISGPGNTCAAETASGNKLVSLTPFSANYTIPYKTPFELIGPTAVDSVADTAITYSWEQWNLGDFGNRLDATFFSGPIFRSYDPVYNSTRVFPKVSMVLAGTLSNVGIENNEGEKAPDTARYLTFKMTVRDILNGNGCVTMPDDTIHLNAVSTGTANGYAGFKVTSQSVDGLSYHVGSAQTVTWNVVGTNAAPVSCDSVNVYFSGDNGLTWPYFAGQFGNSGTASVTIPSMPITATARVKVKGKNNVFFNVNSKYFAVTASTGVQNTSTIEEIKLYPVPAKDVLHVGILGTSQMQVVITNTIGQVTWKGQVSDQTNISVSGWARGVYYAQFINAESGQRTTKSFVVE